MYQNIPISIIDEPLASKAFAITAERRAAIQDEINAWERYPKPNRRQFGGGGSVASVGQRRLDQVSLSAMGRHESAHIGLSSYERPRNMRGVPQDIGASKLHEPRQLFEEKRSYRQAVSRTELLIREPGFRDATSPISESNYDIDFPILFGSDPVIDGPLLPSAKVKLKQRHVLKDGGYTVSNSTFYLPCPPQIDYMRSIAPVEGCLPPFPGRSVALPSFPLKM